MQFRYHGTLPNKIKNPLDTNKELFFIFVVFFNSSYVSGYKIQQVITNIL